MKKNIFILICVFSMLRPVTANAGDFFFNLYGGSSNLWSSAYLDFPTGFINGLISAALNDDDDMMAFGGPLRYDIFNIKEDGCKVPMYRGKWWGFKAKDMFSNVQYGLRFGWQPELSPFGIYISCDYQFNRFEAQFDSSVDTYDKYKLHSIRPGVGIRLTPFLRMLRNKGWSPIIEAGTSYNYYLGCSAPYESDKDQFNSGMISTFAIGSRFRQLLSLTAGVEIYHYSMFDKDFSYDGVTRPYADVTSSKYTVFISVSHDF